MTDGAPWFILRYPSGARDGGVASRECQGTPQLHHEVTALIAAGIKPHHIDVYKKCRTDVSVEVKLEGMPKDGENP